MNQENWDFETITSTYIREYRKDMLALRVREPNLTPRTSYFVPQTIRFIEGLIEKRNAYTVEGEVYFDVMSFPEYGALSHRKIEDLLAGARIEVDPLKRNSADFSLWKKAKPGEPFWDSPWGKGRPGWHIECSVMASELLGETFDIHAGGNDLIFPHHENEKAQSECLTGKTFANLWVHNGMLQMGGSKMAKSVGNIIKIREAIDKYGVDGIRLYMLGTHYRSPIEYLEERMDDWKKSANRVMSFLEEIEKSIEDFTIKAASSWLLSKRKLLREALDDDFNTPKAIAMVFEILKELSPVKETADSQEGTERLKQAYYFIKNDIGDIFGLFQNRIENGKKKEDENTATISSLVDFLLRLRSQYRSEKNFEMSDRIREELEQMNIKIMDDTHGTSWYRT
jgi:cysteinyl-tRNA synthetase